MSTKVSIRDKLCKGNISISTGYGCNADIIGPHHWVRVGTQKIPVPIHDKDIFLKVQAQGHQWPTVDKLIWECVYCLKIKQQE